MLLMIITYFDCKIKMFFHYFGVFFRENLSARPRSAFIIQAELLEYIFIIDSLWLTNKSH